MYSFLKAFLVLMKLLSLSQFYAPKTEMFLNSIKVEQGNISISDLKKQNWKQ